MRRDRSYIRVLNRAACSAAVLVLLVPALPVAAQPDAVDLEALLRRIEQLERTVAGQQAVIDELRRKLEPGAAPTEATPDAAAAELERRLAEELGVTPAPAAPSVAPPPGTLIRDASGRNYLNLSLDGLVTAGTSSEPDVPGLQPGSHDPSRRGFTVQNVEVVLSGAVDPYFTGQANIIFVESPEGETEVEVEEVYVTTSSLPGNLQVRAGHFYSEFGRHNTQHPHFWDFVDQPLAAARMFGGDGLRSSGARLSWLMPTPFYSELFLAVQNAFGETLPGFGSVGGEELFGRVLGERGVRTAGDLLYVPRWAASFDLTPNQTLLVGASAALGPNATGNAGTTELYGFDAFWKWKSPRAIQGFPFVKLQAEGFERRYRADQPFQRFSDHGAYGQVVWGFTRGWTVGARYGEIGGDDGGVAGVPGFEDRWRASANLTWFPTEYSKLRLQYNHDGRELLEDADSLWLQLEFILGAHAAHKF